MSVNLSRDVASWGSAVAQPALPISSVQRRALLARLEQADEARAVTLAAGAGYGKSTLLAQWADRWRSRRGQVLWVTVPSSADVSDVVGSLLAEAGDPIGRRPLTYDEPAWSSVTVPRLVDRLGAMPPQTLVVLDDVMHLTGPTAEQLLEAIVTGLPEASQLAIGTRETTPLALRRLRQTGRTLELDASDLALSAEETLRVLEGLDLAHDVAAELVGRTEGWPVGVFLMGLALKSEPNRMAVEGDVGLTPGWVTDYLHDELFDRLDRATADFLLQVCVLDDLTGEVCDVLTEEEGSLARLRDLAATISLVSRVDGPEEGYRLHQLFAEFLRGESHARSTSTFRQMHGRAFDYYLDRGDDTAAMVHGRQMGDDRRLAAEIWSRAWYQLTRGRVAVVRGWLRGLADERLAAEHGLVLAAFYASLHSGTRERTEWLIEVLSSAQWNDQADAQWEPQRLLALATAGRGGLGDIIDQTGQALDVLGPARDPWMTLALYLRGVALTLLGQPEQARRDLTEGVDACLELGVMDMRAHCLAALAALELGAGDARRALELATEARDIAFSHGLEHIPVMSPAFANCATVMLAHGLEEEATLDALRALRLMSLMESVAPWHAVAGRVGLAQVFHRLGDGERADVLLREAEALRGSPGVPPTMDAIVSAARKAVDVRQPSNGGASRLTTAELRVLQYLPTHLSFPEIGQQLYLSRHTIKSQAVSAYRKLGVSSRSEAVERGRELGLLPVR